MSEPFVLSIEHAPMASKIHPFHLGTDERVARGIAVEMFFASDARTVALKRDGKLFDVFDGDGWHNARHMPL